MVNESHGGPLRTPVRAGDAGARGRSSRRPSRRPDAAGPRSPGRGRPHATSRPEPRRAHAHARGASDAGVGGGRGAGPRVGATARAAAGNATIGRGRHPMNVTMRWIAVALTTVALLAGGVLEVALGQTAPIEGMDRLSPDERAI